MGIAVDFACNSQQTEYTMRTILLAICSLAYSTAALASDANCQAAATAQKLVGTAKTAFLKKCEIESKQKLTLVNNKKNMSHAPTSEFGHCHQSDKDL